MKKIIKLLFMLILMTSIVAITDQASASTTKEKVYREYNLPKEAAKFPIKLTNGLTVTTTQVKGKIVPVIKKDSKIVWQGTALSTNSKVRFTVSKNQDTFFYHSQTVAGTGDIDLIGVNKAGQVFINEKIKEDVLLRMDFLSATRIEVGVDTNPYGEYRDFASYFFQLHKDGTIEQVNYFDQAFFDSLKKKQLKWTAGAIGTTYKNLQPKVTHLDSKPYYAEDEGLSTWKVSYNLGAGKKYGVLEQNQQIEAFYDRNIVANEYEVKSAFQAYLGTPIYEYDDSSGATYKIGGYDLLVQYKSNTVRLSFEPSF